MVSAVENLVTEKKPIDKAARALRGGNPPRAAFEPFWDTLGIIGQKGLKINRLIETYPNDEAKFAKLVQSLADMASHTSSDPADRVASFAEIYWKELANAAAQLTAHQVRLDSEGNKEQRRKETVQHIWERVAKARGQTFEYGKDGFPTNIGLGIEKH